MQKLPRLSGREVVKALSKTGFLAVRQKGSHVILKKQTVEGMRTTVVPLHKEVDQLVYKLYELTPEEIKIVEGFNGK